MTKETPQKEERTWQAVVTACAKVLRQECTQQVQAREMARLAVVQEAARMRLEGKEGTRHAGGQDRAVGPILTEQESDRKEEVPAPALCQALPAWLTPASSPSSAGLMLPIEGWLPG